jgi:hypothetical protein
MRKTQPKTNVNLEKDIRAFFGTSGSGKSHEIKKTIAKAKRCLVFDPEGEYEAAGFQPVRSPAEFARIVQAHHMKPMRMALEAGGAKAFDLFCRVVWWERDARARLVAVVDELAGVTSVAKAPDAWHAILTRGRKYGLRVCAGAQSPTEVDKTLMRQRSALWVGAMERGADYEYMARETGLDATLFESLRPAPHWDHVLAVKGKEPKLWRDGKYGPVRTGV